ncbi:hypothetical protein [Streptomyces sp. NBC_01803]|uniref:hypothetical protein n=1 Tax=Streptomyces sp. NBC_01803 TaxID=2975946 RepID=UPI002DD9A59A|nr:hypothetical protein [Streptomyces sp. NBC_01803]WSA47352.1 hypothetical protein OIE51_26165 [Streptomyces sp. NBC_01803]
MSSDEKNLPGTEPVRVRAEGDIDEDVLGYARRKIDALVSRPGTPGVTGEVKLVRAATRHAGHPWSATAEVRMGTRLLVAVAEEATFQETIDKLQDRLRRQMAKAVVVGVVT